MPKVFLSYSHQDNEVPPDWVNTFYKDLSNYSKVYSGNHNLEIWKDNFNRDVRSESIEERIKQGLKDSDILIALVSPSYLESWWSAFEREYFVRFVLSDKPDEVKKSRILNVIKLMLSPDDTGKLTRELKLNFTYSFCRQYEGISKTVRRDEAEYEKTMVALASSIALKLRENKSSRKFKVFIGKTPEDTLLDNNRLITELESLKDINVEIQTAGNYGESFEEQSKEIEAIIESCDFAVHLFGDGRGFEISKFQWEKVVECVKLSGRNTKVISWLPTSTIKSIDKEDSEHAVFLKSRVMKLDSPFHDFIVNSFEDLLISLKEKLKA
jgi:hypothetical protein